MNYIVNLIWKKKLIRFVSQKMKEALIMVKSMLIKNKTFKLNEALHEKQILIWHWMNSAALLKFAMKTTGRKTTQSHNIYLQALRYSLNLFGFRIFYYRFISCEPCRIFPLNYDEMREVGEIFLKNESAWLSLGSSNVNKAKPN